MIAVIDRTNRIEYILLILQENFLICIYPCILLENVLFTSYGACSSAAEPIAYNGVVAGSIPAEPTHH